MNRRMKRVVTIACGGALALVAGVAFAAYLSNGTGSGATISTTAVDATISPASTGTPLYPGATGTFTVSINNPNDYPVKVLTVSAGASAATGTAGVCTAGSVTSDALAPAPGTVIAPSGSGTYTLTSRMVADPADGCQGGTFSLPLTATLASAAG